MQKVRRLWLLMIVYLLGALTYSISIELLLVIVVPLICVMLMFHDEKSFQSKQKMHR
ncbi:hypothetical protein [Carnobacterium divergens]|uniref:hypothetical protein n=1 Tax=Carnobacterium divergens TaxID=2748 RepID=UPI0039B0E98E